MNLVPTQTASAPNERAAASASPSAIPPAATLHWRMKKNLPVSLQAHKAPNTSLNLHMNGLPIFCCLDFFSNSNDVPHKRQCCNIPGMPTSLFEMVSLNG
jgi:hypothetical protein